MPQKEKKTALETYGMLMKCFIQETHQCGFQSCCFLNQFFKVIYNTVFSLKFLTSLGCVLLAEGLTAKTWDSCGRWSVLHSARKPSAAYAESGRHFLECKQPPCLIFTENGPKRCLLEGLRLYLDSEIQTGLYVWFPLFLAPPVQCL